MYYNLIICHDPLLCLNWLCKFIVYWINFKNDISHVNLLRLLDTFWIFVSIKSLILYYYIQIVKLWYEMNHGAPVMLLAILLVVSYDAVVGPTSRMARLRQTFRIICSSGNLYRNHWISWHVLHTDVLLDTLGEVQVVCWSFL